MADQTLQFRRIHDVVLHLQLHKNKPCPETPATIRLDTDLEYLFSQCISSKWPESLLKLLKMQKVASSVPATCI